MTSQQPGWTYSPIDAGMGETEYNIFYEGVFFAKVNNRADVAALIYAMKLSTGDARPAPSPFPKTIPKTTIGMQSEFEKRSDFLIWLKAHDAAIAAQAREGESIRWSTVLNTLIATESKRKDKESVDVVYSYRIAQTIQSLRTQERAP